MDLPLDEPVFRRDALAGGYTDAQLRQLYSREGWERLGHGAYISKAELKQLGPEDLHRVKILSLSGKVSPDAAISHQSAAVMYGLPLLDTALDLVHVTRNRRTGGRSTEGLRIHGGQFDENQLAYIGGVDVTSLARTVVDLARTLPFEDAVVVGDAALHGVGEFRVSTEELQDELIRARGLSGAAAARSVIPFLNAASESPGESRSRVMFDRAGMEPPGLQGDVHDQRGVWLGRCDFFWEEHSLIGEFDGKDKYGKLLEAGQEATEAVYAEKVRANLMRAAGFHLVRWGWDDVDNPDLLVGELRSLMEGCVCTREKGSIRPSVAYPGAY